MGSLHGLKCKSLLFIIPQILLLEKKEVYLLSPFLSDFKIFPPKNSFSQNNNFWNFLFEVKKSNNFDLKIITRPESEKFLKKYFDLYNENLNEVIIFKDNFHTKAIITSNFVYTGSANLTYNGFYVNEESCQLGLTEDNKELVDYLLRSEV